MYHTLTGNLLQIVIRDYRVLKLTFPDPKSKCIMDWKKCCACQTDKSNEGLIDPSSIKGPNICRDLLGIFAELIAKYRKKGFWPKNSKLDYSKLNTGNTGELVDWLKANKAKYHSSCRKEFSQYNLTRLESTKRKLPEQDTKEEHQREKRRLTDNGSKCEAASKDDTKNTQRLPCVFPFCKKIVLPDDKKEERFTQEHQKILVFLQR